MNVLALIEAGDDERALEEALRLWEECPRIRVAELVRSLAAELPPATSDASLSQLLATPRPAQLSLVLERVLDPKNSVKTLERLRLLLDRWPADPRITEYLLGYFEYPRFDIAGGNPLELYRFLVEQLNGLRDERLFMWWRTLEEFFRAHRGTRHGQLSQEEIDALRDLFAEHSWHPLRVRRLTADEQEHIKQVFAKLEQRAQRKAKDREVGRALLQEVIDRWDSDAPKHAYGDWLQHQGHPQGELIALQLLGEERELSHAEQRRVEELCQAAARRLPSSFELCKCSWRKGFVTRVEFYDGDRGYKGDWGFELEWGSVHSADLPPCSDACHTEQLRELTVATSYLKSLGRLFKPLAVTHLTWRSASERGRAAWRKIRVLPELRKLTFVSTTTQDFLWFFELPIAEQIDELTVHCPGRGAALEHAKSYFDASDTLRRVVVGEDESLQLEWRDKRLWLLLHVRGTDQLESLVRQLRDLPRPFVEVVEVRGPELAVDYTPLLALGAEHTLALDPDAQPESPLPTTT